MVKEFDAQQSQRLRDDELAGLGLGLFFFFLFEKEGILGKCSE
jgi:hypothetical protein